MIAVYIPLWAPAAAFCGLCLLPDLPRLVRAGSRLLDAGYEAYMRLLDRVAP